MEDAPMTDPTRIPPAVRAEEWAHIRSGATDVAHLYFTGEKAAVMAAANDELPDGSPYKFTHEDARLLRESVQRLEELHDDWCAFYCQCVGARNALAKIEALLPPK